MLSCLVILFPRQASNFALVLLVWQINLCWFPSLFLLFRLHFCKVKKPWCFHLFFAMDFAKSKSQVFGFQTCLISPIKRMDYWKINKWTPEYPFLSTQHFHFVRICSTDSQCGNLVSVLSKWKHETLCENTENVITKIVSLPVYWIFSWKNKSSCSEFWLLILDEEANPLKQTLWNDYSEQQSKVRNVLAQIFVNFRAPFEKTQMNSMMWKKRILRQHLF